MSIATKTGDAGMTGLMFNRRVSKCHPRVEACGVVDELNSVLGLARASSAQNDLRGIVEAIQKDLVPLMGELATLDSDLAAYIQGGFARIGATQIEKLDQYVHTLEKEAGTFQGWVRPGANIASATLDLARTVCRRAERVICGLAESGQLGNKDIIIYLNRLGDILWLLARKAEQSKP
jgi:cob(I)alamin adenosyltransferase